MSETEKVCSCFGHFDVEITDALKRRVENEIAKAIQCNFRVFLFGGRSDFDDLVYDIVTEIKAKEQRAGIKRVFCFPLYNQI